MHPSFTIFSSHFDNKVAFSTQPCASWRHSQTHLWNTETLHVAKSLYIKKSRGCENALKWVCMVHHYLGITKSCLGNMYINDYHQRFGSSRKRKKETSFFFFFFYFLSIEMRCEGFLRVSHACALPHVCVCAGVRLCVKDRGSFVQACVNHC